MRTQTVLVPAHVAIVIDRDGIRFEQPPPQWWIDATSPDFDDIPTTAPAATAGPPVNWERVARVAALMATGLPDGEIAKHLCMHPAQVARDKARLGLSGRRGRGVPYVLTMKGWNAPATAVEEDGDALPAAM